MELHHLVIFIGSLQDLNIVNNIYKLFVLQVEHLKVICAKAASGILSVLNTCCNTKQNINHTTQFVSVHVFAHVGHLPLLLAVMSFARALKCVALFGFTDVVADDILSIIFFHRNVLDCFGCIFLFPVFFARAPRFGFEASAMAIDRIGSALFLAPAFFVGVFGTNADEFPCNVSERR